MADPKDTLSRFAKAVHELVAQDDLVHADPGEPAITGVLVDLMKPHFPEWTVRGQWNRREQAKKLLLYAGTRGEAALRQITPDIIVHHAGTQEENLLVVEAKRHTNTEHADDIGKLEGMTALDGEYRYEVGAHLILDIAQRRVVACDIYINGKVDAGLTGWIRELLP